MESFVNLARAVFALWMITMLKTAPDKKSPLGHSLKAEYFSSGFEGILIFGAAGPSSGRQQLGFFHQHLEQVGFGLALSLGASLINLFVALSMRRASRFRSMALGEVPGT